MGNSVSPCCLPIPNPSAVKLIFWEGPTRTISAQKKPLIAGEVMSEFPDRIVCHAESFYMGRPVPALSAHEELSMGQTYFVLPADRFALNVLSVASLSSLSSSFEYVKGSNNGGETLIRVLPEFLMRVISGEMGGSSSSSGGRSVLCTTPELRKQYVLLVGSRERRRPKLETIAEAGKVGRRSPVRFLGLERR
ncbi:hypothetical protein QJS04_geneDACA016599 [Acorus gramineus]|uniref:Uncharacterized protein n=1 Tax=Acorus gramineus TaxID=55184 RepID=A0AAV9BNC3_ACOGR|nr:hypothetical protein QJS04_geneDACA016599 [Acorus gramineus]